MVGLERLAQGEVHDRRPDFTGPLSDRYRVRDDTGFADRGHRHGFAILTVTDVEQMSDAQALGLRDGDVAGWTE